MRGLFHCLHRATETAFNLMLENGPYNDVATIVANAQRSECYAREVISTPGAPQYPSFTQAEKVGNTIYVAGTIGVDVKTGELAGPTIQAQVRQSLLNCQTILRAGGAELSDVVMAHGLTQAIKPS